MCNKRRLKKINILQSSILCAGLSILLFSADITAFASIRETSQILLTTTSPNDPDILGIVGKVTGRVNVRTKAGENSERVIYNGEGVRLQRGEKVLIIGEEMVGLKAWYQISFERGGEELIGYATSTYIEKTSTVITPEPTTTAEPTATPEPTPTKVPSVTPEPTILNNGTSGNGNGGSGDRMFNYIAVVVASFITLGVIGAAILHRKKDEEEYNEHSLSRKLENLKHIKLDKSTNSKMNLSKADTSKTNTSKKNTLNDQNKFKNPANNQGKKINTNSVEKRRKQINPVEEFAATKEQIAEPMVSVLYTTKQILEAKNENYKDGEEKKALRMRIQKLREHDIVIHKYFGRGEVFDNSDVRLIEVRFGNDVRFLNKDNLAAKKLLTITNERNL